MPSKDRTTRQTETGGREATAGVIAGRYSLSVGDPKTAAPSGWNWTKLSTIARLEGGHTPSRRVPEYWNGDIPWIGIADATQNHGRAIYETLQTIAQSGVDNSSTRLLPGGTVCLSRTASIGYVVEMGRPMCTSQDFVNWVCSESIDSAFLRYVLVSEHDSMGRFASGTTHQTIYYPEAKAFHVCLPPMSEQIAIAGILGSLDNQIENMREQSELISDIARVIFKSWFVDFDPVRAKAEGREPKGMDAQTASLFPSEFQEGKSRPIPKGWRIAAFSEVADVIYGAPFASKAFNGTRSGLPLIRIRDLKTMDPEVFTPEVHPKGYLVSPGEVLVGMDGEFRAYFWLGEPAWLNQRVCVFKPTRAAGRVFVRESLRPLLEDVERGQVGTTVIHIGKADIERFETVLTPPPILNAFDRLATPLLDKIISNAQTVRSLTQVRDTLLPRLISGKLRVPEAEKVVVAAL